MIVRRLERCASTNDEAATWARDGAPEFAVVVADAQTRGRGRLGRTWQSPAGENLYFSMVLRPKILPQQAAPITLAAGVALAEALIDLGVVPSLKWPNDVLVGGKKVAGILCEMSTRGMQIEHVIVGIGVNVGSHPPDLPATCLREILGRAVDRGAVLEPICASLREWEERLVALGPEPIVRAWQTHANLLGTRVTVSAAGGKLSGIAEALDPDGALRLRADDGAVHRIIAGELS